MTIQMKIIIYPLQLSPPQVYMGVDVFGRGSYGGGGDQCHVAVQAAMRCGLSAALFAPGWLYENADNK